ncbi:MAG: AAA family ATPase [Candidatus Gastranaerophilales bacterium]|nr:AAA family ATPase [Candidatus Gastranaerophilales bacterium]
MTVAEKLKTRIQEGEFNQKEVARLLDVSETTLSLYLNGTYRGNSKNIDKKVEKFLLNADEKKVYEVHKIKLDFVQTTVAKRVYNIAKMCQFNGEIGVCFGRSGFGKTTACKQYAEDNYGVFWLDPDEKSSKNDIIRLLSHLLGINEDYVVRAVPLIVNKLNNSNYLIIVDEAENLKSPVFRLLRKIHDRCNFTFGLLFVGTERLYYNLARMKGEFEYLTNRISCVENLQALKETDIKALAEQVFANIDEKCLKTFKEVSHSNARELFNLLKRTKDLINSGKPLTPQTIHAASTFLIGGNY